jgi:phosphomannomutase
VSDLIISVSGLRGIVGENLTPEVAIRYVAAFARLLPPGPIVVGRDGRTTGPMLAAAVQSALLATGRQVLEAGIAATPTLGVLVRAYRAAGGVQISASHNPPEYNGLKLFNAAGRVIPAGEGQAVRAAYQQGETAWASYEMVGEVETLADTTSDHLTLLLKTVDATAIRRRRFRVLLDSNAGAGSILGRKLLEELGCQVILLGGEPSGQFEHPAEPTAANLAGVRLTAVDAQADIAFCQDPDADRLAIIDEMGRYIGEEYTLAICLDHVLRQQSGAVVANCATSRMSQDLAERYGSTYTRSAVGEANVVDEMLARKAIFGGEGNGGPIDPRIGYVRDSFVGMALTLAAMSERGMKASQLADELPRYEIRKTTIQLSSDMLPAALAAVERHFSTAQADRLDGLRLDWADRWLIVRGSNTEPLVRAIAEAPTAEAAAELCAEAAQVIAGAQTK